LTRCDRSDVWLLETYFEGTSFEQFEQDLMEKDTILLMRDAAMDGSRIFDHDAARCNGWWGTGRGHVFRRYDHRARTLGSTLLARLWVKAAFAEADRVPDTPFYWFLICSGYKTWRYLPVFFRTYWPHPDGDAPAFDRQVLDAFARAKFGDQYDCEVA